MSHEALIHCRAKPFLCLCLRLRIADEFNRLVPEVLSVCSVQFKAVCDGIRAKRSTVVIEGDEVHLDWSAGAFITMNPGYLGASLPLQGRGGVAVYAWA